MVLGNVRYSSPKEANSRVIDSRSIEAPHVIQMPSVKTAAPSEAKKQVDIVHLTYRSPLVSGSYNRLVGAQIERLTEYRQVAISCWPHDQPECEDPNGNLITVRNRQLPLWQKMYLRLPVRVRRRWPNPVGGEYAWHVLRILPELKPKIVVCYDLPQFGSMLRRVVDWPCRLILSQHGLSYFLNPGYAEGVYSLRSFDAVSVLTHASYRYDKNRMHAYESLVKVLPNGVDVEKFKPATTTEKENLRRDYGLPQNAAIALMLSRLVPKKGAHLILQSWPKILQEMPNAYLWIVGGGEAEYEAHLKKIIKALGISGSVRLQGAVSPESTAACYQAADLYLFPTLCFEGQSLSLLEAMSSGLPCIVSDQEFAREICREQELLFVSDPNLEDAFVEPLIRLLRDPALSEQIGESARATVQQQYSYEASFARIREFYRQQLSLVGGSE